MYSRTIEEVERAAEELIKFMDINKRKGDQCVLGLDIEWRPTFKKGNFICENIKENKMKTLIDKYLRR